MDKSPDPPHLRKRRGLLPLNSVFPLIGSGITCIEAFGVKVTINTDKLKVFVKDQTCALCKKVIGKHFAVERQLNDSAGGWALYMYGLHNDTGEYVLMNVDHKKASSRGGTSKRSNLQTMCEPCNLMKGPYDVDGLSYEEVVAFKSHMVYELHSSPMQRAHIEAIALGFLKPTDSKLQRTNKIYFFTAIKAVESRLREANGKGP